MYIHVNYGWLTDVLLPLQNEGQQHSPTLVLGFCSQGQHAELLARGGDEVGVAAVPEHMKTKQSRPVARAR